MIGLKALRPPKNDAGEERRPTETKIYSASQWQLMWWRFRRHKLAMAGGAITAGLYLVSLFAEFLAPTSAEAFSARYTYAPPQSINWFNTDGNSLRWEPYVNGYEVEVDPVAFRRIFTVDESAKYPLQLFAKGTSYQLWGIFELDVHLIGTAQPNAPLFLLGADRLGRDVLSRLIFGTRVSMSIGLVGVALSLVLGIILGGISGFYGGAVDTFIQRVIEFLRSIPTVPLWLGLAAALPQSWSPVQVYFGITLIISLIGWTGLARVVRGRFLALREEDFVMAARLDGSSNMRLILYHMVPSFTSHIIAQTTLSIPHMILSETSLSFLGLGLRPPAVSWGVLLQEAQNVRALVLAPWLFWPGVGVVIAVLALNFLGDGLRDAADPYHR